MGRWGEEIGVVSSWAVHSESPNKPHHGSKAKASGTRVRDTQQDAFQEGVSLGFTPPCGLLRGVAPFSFLVWEMGQ